MIHSKMKPILVTAACFVVFVLCAGNPQSLPTNVNPEETTVSGNSENILSPKYVLKAYNGYIGVFVPPKLSQPYYITDIDLRTLTRADYNTMVTTGIELYSDIELISFLEDFGS